MSDIGEAALLIAGYCSTMSPEALMGSRRDRCELLVGIGNTLKAIDDVLRVASIAAVGNDEEQRFLSVARFSMETLIDAVGAADAAAGKAG